MGDRQGLFVLTQRQPLSLQPSRRHWSMSRTVTPSFTLKLVSQWSALALSVSLLISLAVTASCQQPTTSNVKAVWISTYTGCTNRNECVATINNLADRGFNRVYVDVWNNGLLYFPSPTMNALIPAKGLATARPLDWAIPAARGRGMQVFAWFEYGLIAQYSDCSKEFCKAALSKKWVVAGSYNSYIWLDAANVEVQTFIGNLLVDVVKSNPLLTGVQLDDHFAYPSALVGAKATVMTECAKKVRAIFRASSSALLSLSPYPETATAKSRYNVDWVLWQSLGLFSEWLPQWYSASDASFQASVQNTLKHTYTSQAKYTIASVRCQGDPPTSSSSLSAQLAYTRRLGLGLSIWNSDCVTLYPALFPVTKALALDGGNSTDTDSTSTATATVDYSQFGGLADSALPPSDASDVSGTADSRTGRMGRHGCLPLLLAIAVSTLLATASFRQD